MQKEEFKCWLEKYLRCQEQHKPEIIKEIFAEDGVYWWGPFNEARHGVEAIYQHHKKALSHQENIKYTYEILATTDDYGIAKFYLTLKDLAPNEPETYDGIFLVYLNDSNKCTLFQEWYHGTMKDGILSM